MKKLVLFLAFVLFMGMNININAQSNVTLIVCERYDMDYGPIGVGSRFTVGYITVVAMSNNPMYYEKVYVQYDKMDKDGSYKFYKRFPFMFPDGNETVYFARVGKNNMEFNHTGYYYVFLLDKNKEVIASTFVEIVN